MGISRRTVLAGAAVAPAVIAVDKVSADGRWELVGRSDTVRPFRHVTLNYEYVGGGEPTLSEFLAILPDVDGLPLAHAYLNASTGAMPGLERGDGLHYYGAATYSAE